MSVKNGASAAPMNRSHPPTEVLWCGNVRGKKKGLGWQFPPNVAKRIQQDCVGKTILHLFGGRSKFGTRLDIDPLVRPDVIGDAWLPPFGRESFDVVVLDPPYIRFNCQEKAGLFLNAAWIARERVIWFHTIWAAAAFGLCAERAWLVRVGDSCHARCLQYFRITDRRGPRKYFTRGPAMKYNRWLAGEQLLEGLYADPS